MVSVTVAGEGRFQLPLRLELDGHPEVVADARPGHATVEEAVELVRQGYWVAELGLGELFWVAKKGRRAR